MSKPPTDDSLAALGRAISNARKARRLTQRDVASAAGLHETYISLIERGIRNPTWTVVAKIAAVLRISLAELAALAQQAQLEMAQERKQLPIRPDFPQKFL